MQENTTTTKKTTPIKQEEEENKRSKFIPKKITPKRKGYTRRFKTLICSVCKNEYIAIQERKNCPNRCGECHIKVHVRDYRRGVNKSFDPPRY